MRKVSISINGTTHDARLEGSSFQDAVNRLMGCHGPMVFVDRLTGKGGIKRAAINKEHIDFINDLGFIDSGNESF